jgi:hypothetical protein
MPFHEEPQLDRAQLAPARGEDRRTQETDPAHMPAPASPQPDWDEVDRGLTKLESLVAG